jgi:hypothetical protein
MARAPFRPTRPDPVASFSEHFAVDPDEMEDLGVFDPILERDSPFAINPKLLDSTTVPELRGGHDLVLQRFIDVMTLLEHAEVGRGAMWRSAFELFYFPEFAGASIGYSAQRGDGRGWPRTLRHTTLITGKDIVDAGIRNPRIFELVGLFQDGVGLDLVSDMIGTILRHPLMAYTQRMALELGAPVLPHSGALGFELPTYLNQRGEPRFVVLMPQEILSDLPVALDREDIARVASANEEVRAYLNAQIGHVWLRDRRLDKRAIRDAIVRSPKFAEEVLARYARSRSARYDFARDPRNAIRWLRTAKYEASQIPLEFSIERVTTLEEAIMAVRELLLHFRYLVEQTRVRRALYNGTTPRNEVGVQDVFYAVAASHSIFRGLDVNAEVLTGHGTVDYKFSIGRDVKIVVELKLARSAALLDGLEIQLPAYARAEQADHAFYLVVNNGGTNATRNLQRLEERLHDRDAAGLPDVIICDAVRQPSASRRRREGS